MKHEAKFSVIIPANDFTATQIDAFEETTQRYGIPVNLPLRSDGHGNLIAASKLTLRDAQHLRRQIAGCGFPADVVSDSAEATRVSDVEMQSLDTLVVDLADADYVPEDSLSDMASDAWASIDMPSLDLGLGDDDNLSNAQSNGNKTLSLSAHDILKVVQDTGQSEDNSANDIKTQMLSAPSVEMLQRMSSSSESDIIESSELQIICSHDPDIAKESDETVNSNADLPHGDTENKAPAKTLPPCQDETSAVPPAAATQKTHENPPQTRQHEQQPSHPSRKHRLEIVIFAMIMVMLILTLLSLCIPMPFLDAIIRAL